MEKKIDTNLYSRQIGTFGMETMSKLIKMHVLICGCKGLGTEVAKNLVLAGPASVTLFDSDKVETKDLGSNFYLTQNDVGKPRSVAISSRLAELNEYVTVSAHTGDLALDFIHNFDVVVMTHGTRAEIDRISAYCRERKKFNAKKQLCNSPIGFIAADIRGVAGYVFTDFGEQFTVRDKDGEPAFSGIITNITNAKEGIVTLHTRHTLYDGDHVSFSEVEGMEELNSLGPVKVKRIDASSFSIGDTTSYGAYIRQGTVTEVKVPQKINFPSFRDFCGNPFPEYPIHPDFNKVNRPQLLHLLFQGFWAFQEAKLKEHGSFDREEQSLPRIRDEGDAEAVAKYAAAINEENKKQADKGDSLLVVDDLDTALIQKMAQFAQLELPPVAATFGGIVAQEIVKFTGKFTPLTTPLYLDFAEVIPEQKPSDIDLDHAGRYYSQIAMFGRSFQEKLNRLKYFLVGAGALGCEYLKGFAMMGIACSKEGKLTVTDMDNIELSNLNRQFLFRKDDIGSPKSVCAARAAVQMNTDLNVEALEVRVGHDTETTFNDEFWTNLSGVCNALDNVKARLYVDQKCLFYRKSLLEAGTLGAKGNTQIVVPFKTQSYGDVKDPPEVGIPMCTLRNFPHKIEHCIEYARSAFEGLFSQEAMEAKVFAKDPDKYINSLTHSDEAAKLDMIVQTLQAAQDVSFEKCVELAYKLYFAKFRDPVLTITHIYPEDHVDQKTGNLYWSGPKRFPQPIPFSLEDEGVFNFMVCTTNLFMTVFGVTNDDGTAKVVKERKPIAEVLETLEEPKYTPPESVHIEDDEEKKNGEPPQQQSIVQMAAEEREKRRTQCRELLAKAGSLSLNPQEFEKDDDSNFHIDFITAFANLRARCYRIPTASRHTCKMVSGKIIPAIATTTATVTGLALVEIYKLLQDVEVEHLRDTMISFATNTYVFMLPSPPPKTVSKEFDIVSGCPVKAIPEGFTPWDQTIVDIGDATVQELQDELCKQLGEPVEISIITQGQGMVFQGSRHSMDDKVSVLTKAVCGEPLDADRRYLQLECLIENDDGDDVIIPQLVFYYK